MPEKSMLRHPKWWKNYCPGGCAVYWADDLILRCATEEDLLAMEEYVENDKQLHSFIDGLYEKYYFIDTTRPTELRTMDFSVNAELGRSQLYKALDDIFHFLPPERQAKLAYIPDKWIVDLTMHKATITSADYAIDLTEAVDIARFSQFCRAVLHDGLMIRLASVTNLRDEENQQSDLIQEKLVEVKRARDKARAEAKERARVEKERAEQLAKQKAEEEAKAREELDTEKLPPSPKKKSFLGFLFNKNG